jgi:hypothetical protein
LKHSLLALTINEICTEDSFYSLPQDSFLLILGTTIHLEISQRWHVITKFYFQDPILLFIRITNKQTPYHYKWREGLLLNFPKMCQNGSHFEIIYEHVLISNSTGIFPKIKQLHWVLGIYKSPTTNLVILIKMGKQGTSLSFFKKI